MIDENMVERVGERLRAECLEVFGSTWNYDNAWRFARAAIAAMREPTEAMAEAGDGLGNPGYDPHTIWRAMIDAALKEPVA